MKRAIGSSPGDRVLFLLSVSARTTIERIAVAKNSVKKDATDVMYDS
jgi:hypothetical protein